jgi:hypothetical protein
MFTIRAMQPDEIEIAAGFTQAEGWLSEIQEDFWALSAMIQKDASSWKKPGRIRKPKCQENGAR